MDQQTKIALFKHVSWAVLEDWAGATIAARGQSYQRSHRVADLARTPEGEIVAWVQGTHRYATLVDWDEQGLRSACTCPYEDTCKHAVAVVLAYREQLDQRREVPTVADTDPRLILLEDDADGWDKEDWDEEDEEDEVPAPPPTESPLRAFLEQQTNAQLIEMLEELAGRFPAVRDALEARRKLAAGTAAELVRDVRRLIATTSAEPGWRNEWDGEGSTPDYAPVRDRLELLLRRGYADEVVSLGETLLKAGTDQVEESHDQGETAEEVASCMDVVFRALVQSSRTPSAKLLWAIETVLRDEYDLCSGVDVVWTQPYTAEDWRQVADALGERLSGLPVTGDRADFSRTYARGRLSSWAITALQRAGREADVIALAEREADLNGDYVRLVKLLIAAGRTAEAEQWITRGIEALGQTQLGTVRELRDTLRDLREQAGDWSGVAAMRAEEFFEHPSMAGLLQLRATTERAGVWPAVRANVLHYLETGEPPEETARVAGDRQIPAWPLLATGLPRHTQRWPAQFPKIGLLIEIAAHERQPGQVLHWYDRRPPGVGGRSDIDESLVADAVADAYPERAIAIWKKLAEAQIAQTQPRAYEVAVSYLRKLRDLLARLGRSDEWRRYVTELRQTNGRKRRLVEMLDGLSRESS